MLLTRRRKPIRRLRRKAKGLSCETFMFIITVHEAYRYGENTTTDRRRFISHMTAISERLSFSIMHGDTAQKTMRG